MIKKKTIAIIESSEIINEGLAIKIKNTTYFGNVLSYFSLETFLSTHKNKEVHVLLANPNQLTKYEKEFKKWYQTSSVELLIAIVYQIYSDEQLKIFHDSYSILEPFNQLVRKITNYRTSSTNAKNEIRNLSDRENEVLKYLAKGLSVKEIADKMFLSPHTILTHRKNISQKTGIKTIAGLTVYAVSTKLISMDELER